MVSKICNVSRTNDQVQLCLEFVTFALHSNKQTNKQFLCNHIQEKFNKSNIVIATIQAVHSYPKFDWRTWPSAIVSRICKEDHALGAAIIFVDVDVKMFDAFAIVAGS